ncbi:hypothetical protein JTE88_01965 [Arcanobacterium phocisimile]|uniref:Integrase catalytic domain-containing protein n=2 Tax=Arcanobacterium TaxID=28263 RepID=A0A6H2EJA3_9ACTO|nr:hypothetical protein HC352_01960 [Arcanobacterium buesumense]QRV02544.1 hypothetical protein JTE88_01965 [Arcanobacterium phocisimile]
MREELLEGNFIENPSHARVLIGHWSQLYDNFPTHSSLSYLSPRQYAQRWRKGNTVNT